MAELNLKQITDKLNSEFASDVRKLVFWYDANAEFQEDIDSIELENAKVLHLEPDNQFYIKYFLEREDTTTNYLVYAPFAKPSIRDNHLADTIRYSKEFFADRASLLTLDLGIDERYKPVIQHYIKFFANKDRTQKFYDLEIENFNRSTIEVALMSVLCKDKTASFEEVLRSILTDDGLQDNKYLHSGSRQMWHLDIMTRSQHLKNSLSRCLLLMRLRVFIRICRRLGNHLFLINSVISLRLWIT